MKKRTNKRKLAPCPTCGARKISPMIFYPYCNNVCWENRPNTTPQPATPRF